MRLQNRDNMPDEMDWSVDHSLDTIITGSEAVLRDACMQIANDSCEECCAEAECSHLAVNICGRVSKQIAATALMIVEKGGV